VNARGLDGTERVEQALYIVDRAERYLEGELDQPVADDLAIMTTVALPFLIQRLDDLAHEINVEDRKY
jgi:hypothetical protein